MSNEMIGILAILGGLVAAVLYFLHTAKGKAELAALEARLKQHTSETVANALPPAQAAPSAPQPIEVHLHQDAPATAPVPAPTPPAAPAGSVTLPDGTVISQAQANLMGITQATVDAMPKAPVAAPSTSTGAPNTDATFVPPINGPYYMRDVSNNGSVTSPSFLMKAGNYSVWPTEGFTRGQGYATLNGVGPLPGSSILVPVDTIVTITMTAIPGNLDPTSGGVTRLCIQFHGPLA